MRPFIAIMTAVLIAASSPDRYAAQESAIGTRLSDYGGFVGLDMRFGNLSHEFAAFAGGEAAVLLKHRVYLGIRGNGLATDNARVSGSVPSATLPVRMGYGGLLLGYMVPTRWLANLSLDAMVGAGGVKAAEDDDDAEWDGVFVFEPSATFDLRLAPVLQLGVGASYRFVGDVDVAGLRDAQLRGFSGLARVRVGWF